MANIKKYTDKIRKSIYGKEVRGSLADGIEAINDEVEDNTEVAVNIEKRQDAVEQQFDDLQQNYTEDSPSDAEIVAGRTNTKTGKNYSTLGKRLDDEYEETHRKIDSNHDDVTAQLADTEQEVNALKDSKIDKAEAATKQELNTKITKGKLKREDLDSSSDVHKWDLNDFNEASRQAILENNNIDINYVLGDGGVTEENLSNGSVTFNKRSRIGELAVVSYSYKTERKPNLDIKNLTLTFYDTFFILNGKKRYTIEGRTEISLEGIGNGVAIFFDTITHELLVKSQTKLNEIEGENFILFAFFYFNAPPFNKLLGAHFNCEYT